MRHFNYYYPLPNAPRKVALIVKQLKDAGIDALANTTSAGFFANDCLCAIRRTKSSALPSSMYQATNQGRGYVLD